MSDLTRDETRRCTEAVSDACRSLGIWHAGEHSQRGFNDHNRRASVYSVWYDGYNVGRYYPHAPRPVPASAPTSDNLIRDRLTGARGRPVAPGWPVPRG